MAGFFSRPMTSGADDYPVGMDELGNVIYSTPMGDTYTVKMQPAPRESVLKGAWNAMREDPLGFGGNVLRGMAEGVWQGVSAPGRAAAGEPVTYGDVAATAMDWALPQVPGLGAKYDPTQVNAGIRAYHGSPHDFDKFSLDHIGTGEGAQAYGHGLYFAEAEDTARFYRDNYAKPDRSQFKTDTARQLAQDQLQSWAGDIEGGISDLKASLGNEKLGRMFGDANEARIADLEDAISYMERGAPKGKMYEVNINADPDDFLDWDAPLSEQPQRVSEALQSAGFTPERTVEDLRGEALSALEKMRGVDAAPWVSDAIEEIASEVSAAQSPSGVYLAMKDIPSAFGLGDAPMWGGVKDDVANAISRLKDAGDPRAPDNYKLQRQMETVFDGPESAASALRQSGIPGIKYKDGMSRGADGGTRNYVVFDDSLIDIVRKYGWAGLAPLGINALSQEQQY